MPWNEPGKGNNKDPWQSGSDQPPDLDEVFGSISKKFRRLFGGSGSSGRDSSGPPLFSFILIALVAWGVYHSAHILDESERGVVLRFGKYARTLQPGLQFTFPAPIEVLTKINVTSVRSLEDRGRMLTGDENLIDVNYAVQFQVENPIDFMFNVKDPLVTMSHAAESAMRETIGTNRMQYILEEGRAQIARDSELLLQEILNRYSTGMVLTQFNLQDVKPPQQVKESFDDVVKAREDEQRFVNEAEAYSNQIIPEARGQAARIGQEAEGYRAARIALAEGESQRFTLLLNEYRKAPEVTRERLYLQTMENVMGRSKKVIMDVERGNNMLYLPLDQMSGDSSTRPVPPLNILGNGIDDANETTTSNTGRDTRRGRD
jgi:membrane protease subunit HflK